MLSLLRGLMLGALLVGVGFVASPDQIGAQDKKDPKKDEKKEAKSYRGKVKLDDSINEKKLSFATSDRLSLQGYWFPAEKDLSDAVMMFPAPGNKINDNWIAMAKLLSDQGFSVLLFDWRGCGLNGPDRNIRIFDDEKEFMKDPFNLTYAPKTATKQGLDYKQFGSTRYRDFLMNDLAAARFFLDKQNDDSKCNTNRTWIVSEGQGLHMGMAFIAAESYRPSIYLRNNKAEIREPNPKMAVKDYAGVAGLSFSSTNTTASSVYKTAFGNRGSSADAKEGKTHFESRMAMIMVYGKKEGPGASRSWISQFVTGNDEQLRLRYKYLREVDNSKAMKPLSGGDLLNEEDTFSARHEIINAMVEVSKGRQDFGKDRTKRNVAELTNVTRFNVVEFKPN